MGVIRKKLPLMGGRRKKDVEWLFDTGASSSFIRPEVVRALGLPTTTLLRPLRIRPGKGSARVSKLAVAMIGLHGTTLADTAYVLPGLSEEFVIGAEFMERYEIRLDPKRRRLLLPPKRRLALILV